MRCLAYVANLGVKECSGLMRDEISTITSLISSVRASVRRNDLFDSSRIEVSDDAKLPVLDVDTRWSSTFRIIKEAFTGRLIFTAVCNRIHELALFNFPEVDWEKSPVVCDFLESAAMVTELLSG